MSILGSPYLGKPLSRDRLQRDPSSDVQGYIGICKGIEGLGFWPEGFCK